jgi:hypothetical protein
MDYWLGNLQGSCYNCFMKTYRLEIKATVEIDAFTQGDAAEAVLDAVYDLEGIGVTLIDVTVDKMEKR